MRMPGICEQVMLGVADRCKRVWIGAMHIKPPTPHPIVFFQKTC